MENFKLIEGIALHGASTDGVPDEFYERIEGGVCIYPSAEKLPPLLSAAAEFSDEPMFFFLELPSQDEELRFETYYLECTKPVADAIVKRYGELLINDGVSRFGFGSHKTGGEICFDTLQRVYVYTRDSEALEKLLLKLKISDAVGRSAAKIFDPDTDDLMQVEINGETVFDIAENLKSAGLYRALE